MQLSRADLEAVLEFLGDLAGLECEQAYSPDFLTRLRDLVLCDALTYQEYEYGARRSCFCLGLASAGPWSWGSPDSEAPEHDEEDLLYWGVGPCPIVHYRACERDLGAIRMSDVISLRRWRELPIYREYFRPMGIGGMLDLGLPDQSGRQRSLILFRAKDAGDFSQRDGSVLELLRPHLYQRERTAELRRQLAEAVQRPDGRSDDRVLECLTQREREIVELVAHGKTNAEIAAQLWVSPSTVKKHLEHVYAKLGVGRRAAVAATHRAARP